MITSDDYKNLVNKDPFILTHSLDGTQPATAANYGVFFIAPFKCVVMFVAVVWQTKCTVDGKLQLERLQGQEALDSGDELFVTDVDLTATINTVVYPVLTLTKTNLVLDRGDRLAFKDKNTLTTTAGLTMTLVLYPIGQGAYRAIK